MENEKQIWASPSMRTLSEKFPSIKDKHLLKITDSPERRIEFTLAAVLEVLLIWRSNAAMGLALCLLFCSSPDTPRNQIASTPHPHSFVSSPLPSASPSPVIIKCYPSSQQLFRGKWSFCNPQCNHSTAVLEDYTASDWCCGPGLSAEVLTCIDWTESFLKTLTDPNHLHTVAAWELVQSELAALWPALQGMNDLSSDTTSTLGVRSLLALCIVLAEWQRPQAPQPWGIFLDRPNSHRKGRRKNGERKVYATETVLRTEDFRP